MNNTQAEPAYGGNMRAVAATKAATVTTTRAAAMLGVSGSAIALWCSQGRLKSVGKSSGKGTPKLFLKSDVEEFGRTQTIHRHKPRAVAAKPTAKRPKKFDTRIVDDPEVHGRIARLVKLLEASNSPFEATIISVTRAALRIGLTQLEKEAKS